MGLFDNVMEEEVTKKNTNRLTIDIWEKVLTEQIDDMKKALKNHYLEVKDEWFSQTNKDRKTILNIYMGSKPSYTFDYEIRIWIYSEKTYASFSSDYGRIKQYPIIPGSSEEELKSLFENILVDAVGHLLGVRKLSRP